MSRLRLHSRVHATLSPPEACASSLGRLLPKLGKSKFFVRLKCSLTVGVRHQLQAAPFGGFLDGTSDGYPLDDPRSVEGVKSGFRGSLRCVDTLLT